MVLNSQVQLTLHYVVLCMCVESFQLCPTLCDPMDCSLPGSTVLGILQARILKWVVIPFSRGSSQPRDQTWVTCVAGRFFTIWAIRKAKKKKIPLSPHLRIGLSKKAQILYMLWICSLLSIQMGMSIIWLTCINQKVVKPAYVNWELSPEFLTSNCNTID